MDIEQARKEFIKLTDNVQCKADLYSWIQHAYLVAHCRGSKPAESHMNLRDIAYFIRTLVPSNSVLPSEQVLSPHSAKKEEDPTHSVFVDAFLYDSNDVDDLVGENKLERFYCKDCNSHCTSPIKHISYSTSRPLLEYIFENFGAFKDPTKVFLDVGSRIGAVLYAAYCHSQAKKIIGVEMNSELCGIQEKVIEKFKMSDRIQIICNDIRQEKSALHSADMIFIQRPFELFLPIEEQISCWKFLASNIKTGAIIISSPSLSASLEPLKTGIDLDSWVRKRVDSETEFFTNFALNYSKSEIEIYDVISTNRLFKFLSPRRK